MRTDQFPLRGLRAMWEELGKPPWYIWPFLLLPFPLVSWWLAQAMLMFVAAAVCLVFGDFAERVVGLVALGLAVFSFVMFLVDIDAKYPDNREPSARLP